MRRKLTAFILCLITLLACSCSKAKEKADSTDDTDSSTIASEVATPTPTPASTYTPGSELYLVIWKTPRVKKRKMVVPGQISIL